MTTKIDLPKHLAEYLKGKFGNEENVVHLPASCSLYFILYELLQRRPAECPVDRGNVEIKLPSPRMAHQVAGKPITYFNYISQRGTLALVKAINTMMKVEAHEFFDENKHVRGIDYIESAYAFLEKYSIENLTAEALLKDYQRWRKKIGRKTIYRQRKHITK